MGGGDGSTERVNKKEMLVDRRRLVGWWSWLASATCRRLRRKEGRKEMDRERKAHRGRGARFRVDFSSSVCLVCFSFGCARSLFIVKYRSWRREGRQEHESKSMRAFLT